MQDAKDAIAIAAKPIIDELAAEMEVTTSRLYEILSKDNPVPKAKRLIRKIGRLNPAGALLIKADFDAMFADICENPDAISTERLHKEAFEAIQARLENRPKGEQASELRDLIAIAQCALSEIENERQGIENRAMRRLTAVAI